MQNSESINTCCAEILNTTYDVIKHHHRKPCHTYPPTLCMSKSGYKVSRVLMCSYYLFLSLPHLFDTVIILIFYCISHWFITERIRASCTVSLQRKQQIEDLCTDWTKKNTTIAKGHLSIKYLFLKCFYGILTCLHHRYIYQGTKLTQGK